MLLFTTADAGEWCRIRRVFLVGATAAMDPEHKHGASCVRLGREKPGKNNNTFNTNHYCLGKLSGNRFDPLINFTFTSISH